MEEEIPSGSCSSEVSSALVGLRAFTGTLTAAAGQLAVILRSGEFAELRGNCTLATSGQLAGTGGT